MLRKKYAVNVKLQSSINESLAIIQASSTPPVRKFTEPHTTSAKQSDDEQLTNMEEPKKEMTEDEKMRKLRKSFEALERPVTAVRNM